MVELDVLLADELLAAPRPPAAAEHGLHLCEACARPFVVPGPAREVVAVDRVRLMLHCVNCGWREMREHSDEELAALEMALDRAFADLLWTLEIVWAANEEAAIELFAAALAADAILPDDFR